MRALDAIRDAGEVFSFILVLFLPASDAPVFCVGDVLLYPHFVASDCLIDFPFHELGGTSTAVTGKRFRTWLLELRNSHSFFCSTNRPLIDRVLEGYNCARHGPEVTAHFLHTRHFGLHGSDVLGGNIVPCAHSFLLHVHGSHP
jgi:hypothetical protein